ncbi:hypothetical protein HK097_004831, partial [Rhizophlyctis rosea]
MSGRIAQSKAPELFGYVIRTAAAKTTTVRVARTTIHKILKKPVTWHTNFHAHDPNQVTVPGDYVRIDKTPKPISKIKSYKLGEIIRPAQRYVDEDGKLHTQAVDLKVWENMQRKAQAEKRAERRAEKEGE